MIFQKFNVFDVGSGKRLVKMVDNFVKIRIMISKHAIDGKVQAAQSMLVDHEEILM